jgi:hypothetical protein
MNDPRRHLQGRAWPALLVLVVSATMGAAALLGSVSGSLLARYAPNAQHNAILTLGAVVGGIVGVLAGLVLASRGGLLPPSASPGVTIAGGLIGFWLAAVLAITHLHSPAIPLASALLPGFGAAVGSVLARTRRQE